MFWIRGRKTWSQYPDTTFEYANWSTRPMRIHHTADSGPTNWSKASAKQERNYLRDVEYFHIKTRGYKAIAYSYIIMPSGRVYEGRGWQAKGAHTLGHNDDIGVCFAGNFTKQKPTWRSKIAYGLLKRRLRMRGARGSVKAYPHNSTFSTACPGKYLEEMLGL